MNHEPIKTITHSAYAMGLLQGIAYNRLHTSLTRALQPFDISIPEWKLLGQLYECGTINLSQLAIQLDYDPPMVTKLAKLLEKNELVIREQDKRDERVKMISITKKGRLLIAAIEPVVKQAMHDILNGVSDKELAVYIRVLSTIVKNTND